MRVKVEVTQEYIERGTPGDPDLCPIALALDKETGYESHVCYSGIQLWKPGTLMDLPLLLYEVKTPPQVNDWIRYYDWGMTVEPISIELDFTEVDDVD